jgi:hypothetical protein
VVPRFVILPSPLEKRGGKEARKDCRPTLWPVSVAVVVCVPGGWDREPFRRSVPGRVFAQLPVLQHPLFAGGPKARAAQGARATTSYLGTRGIVALQTSGIMERDVCLF